MFIGWSELVLIAIIFLAPLVFTRFPASFRKMFGLCSALVGLLLCITKIGAILGIPLLFIGGLAFFAGGGKKGNNSC